MFPTARHGQAGADRGRHRLLDQVDLARAGGQRRIAHGALLDLGDPGRHADDDARLHQVRRLCTRVMK
jgi:hypothetical protein